MFKKVAADALGLSDLGTVVKPQDYDKVEADDYVMHEEQEKIFFLIKSKADEYCFTNKALIHVDGTSAMSKKRTLKRYDYFNNIIRGVVLETAGNIDRDVEIKFSMGEEYYSIDVDKKQIEQLKDLYKALLRIAIIQEENAKMLTYASGSLNTAATSVTRTMSSSSSEEQFKTINQYSFDWMKQAYETYVRKDFSEVFEKFINS
ncbi:MAG: PH domain-containing protein [Anaerolineae bacterium]|nr:PH domain-containing protein [Anaerolineae bacterium]